MQTSSVATWDGTHTVLETVPRSVRSDSTIIEVLHAGVCGTDLHTMRHAKGLSAERRLSLGHEIVGRVQRLGTSAPVVRAEAVAEGDVVVVVPGLACGQCPVCLSFGSHEHLCDSRTVHGFSIFDPSGDFAVGGYSTHIELRPGIEIAKVPDGMSPSTAVLTELVSIAVRAVERGLGQGRPDLGLGSLVAADTVVLGAGPVGCATALVLKATGADVRVVDTNEWRIAYATDELGLDAVLVTDRASRLDEVRAGTSNGLGFDLVVEAGGDPELLATALELARPGGRVVELGNFVSVGSAAIDPSLICRKDLEVVGSVLAPPTAYPKALNLLQRTDLPFHRLASEELGLADLTDVQRVLDTPRYMKRIVSPNA